MERTVHRGMTGVTLRKVFTDLDFADGVSLPAEMLEVLVLALTVTQKEASSFGLMNDKLVENQNPTGSLFHLLCHPHAAQLLAIAHFRRLPHEHGTLYHNRSRTRLLFLSSDGN